LVTGSAVYVGTAFELVPAVPSALGSFGGSVA